MELKKGQIVLSKAGRDKGYFLVVTQADAKSAFVCDGRERPLERPKRKNLKHLSATSLFIESEEMASNSKLRKTLRALDNQGR